MADTSALDQQLAALDGEITALNTQIAELSRNPASAFGNAPRLMDLTFKKGELEKKYLQLQKQRDAMPQQESVQMGKNPWTDFAQAQSFGASNLNLPGMQLGNQDQARQEQARVVQALQAQAAGSRDTLGQQQLQQGFNQASAQQRSLGSSIRGAGGGAGLRAGAMGAADTQRGFAGQSEMLRLQEQQAAQAMLAQLLAQQHAQDVGLAGSMASGSLANQQLNQDMERFYGQLGNQSMLGDYQRAADYQRAKLGYDLESRDLATRQQQQMFGAAAGGVGALTNVAGANQKKPQSGYRQVGGSDSIVPIDDK